MRTSRIWNPPRSAARRSTHLGSALALAAATAALALCACSNRSSSDVGERGNSGRIVVNYWEKWSGYEADAMRGIVDDFNRSQDRIEVRFLSVSQVDMKFLLAASSGNPPDLAGLWSFSIPDFAEKNALTPLDEAIARSEVGAEDYIPLFFELCRHRGFTWGLPTTPGCVGLFYNKKLFREAGLDPERPPRTLDELHEMNRRLTIVELEREGRRVRVAFADLTAAERERKRYSIVQVGHLPQNAGMFVSAWGNWFGAEYFDGDRTILANDPGLRAAYDWLRGPSVEFGVEQIRLFGAGFGVSQSAQSPFLGGSEAMIVQGPWMKNFIDQYAPGLEWGVAPFPAAAGVADGAPVALVETDVIVIPRGAKHPREAFEFIVYLQRQDVAERLALAQGKFTALRRVTPEFERDHPNPAVPTFIELARSPGARAVPRLAIWREYNEELVVAAERVLNLRAEPAEALAEVQERVQWRLDRVMRRWDAVSERRLEEWREHAHW